MKLDLGCGQSPIEGFEGVDIVKSPEVLHCVDLLRPRWPWKDNSVEALFSSHFIEHIPMQWVTCGKLDEVRKDALFHFFDEAYRIIVPGGTFQVVWPSLQTVGAFQDPTHRRYIPIETMYYLNANWRKESKLDHYSVDCDWELTDLRETNPQDLPNARNFWTSFRECKATLTKPLAEVEGS